MTTEKHEAFIQRVRGIGDVLVTNEMMQRMRQGWRIAAVDNGKIYWFRSTLEASYEQKEETDGRTNTGE